MPDIGAVWEVANKGGAILAACSLMFIWGLHRELWRMGKDCRAEIADLRKQLEKSEQRGDRLEALLDRSTHAVNRSIDTAATVIGEKSR